ncbi:hypothetical protein BD779DRAFT_1671623 [Infundibulicybe gibba]|nr:hypothetical protein BD779DRAFT_1671623 [Infundibulicybe gibba]
MALRDKIHDRAGKANGFMGIGQFHLQISETKVAEDKLLEAPSLYNQIGDNLGQAPALNILGHFSTAQSNCDNAEMYYTRALSLNTAGGNAIGQSETISLHSSTHYADHHLIFGGVLIAELKADEARCILNHAAGLCAAAGDRLGGADGALYLYFIYLQQPNSFGQASEMALKLLEGYQAMGSISGQESASATPAMLDIRRGFGDQALKKLETAVAFHRQVNNLSGEALDYYDIDYAQFQNAQYEQALKSLNMAFRSNVKTGNIQGQGDNKAKITEVLLM